MSGLKRKSDELDDEEKVAEAELSAAIAAAEAAPADEMLPGLGSGVAPIYFDVPGISPTPWEYPTRPQPDEKPLVFAYLSIRGLGEVPRLMLAEAGAKYQHIACTMGETDAKGLEWRKRSPNGLMPMLSGLGIPRSEPLSQSGSIIRFLAKKYGMDGADELESIRIDTMFETAKDLNENKKLIIGEQAIDTTQAKGPGATAARLETMIAEFNSPENDSNKMNYAQIQLGHVLMQCDEIKPGCVAKLSPTLDDFRKAMAARPRIAAYLASPMRFPLTHNEVRGEGGHNYTKGPQKRSVFAES